MPVVTYNGIETYDCAKAIMGDTYIHLLDAYGNMIVAFDGIVDFNVFEISGGDWTVPTSDNNCFVAVIREDGTLGKGGHRCSDIGSSASSGYATKYQATLTASRDKWTQTATGYKQLLSLKGIISSDIIILCPDSNEDWAKSYLVVKVVTDAIEISTTELPPTDCILYMYIIRADDTSAVILS